MIKLFRKIRQKLLSDSSSSLTFGRMSKYMLYAAGEIILVVIGILIALQINNQNEIKKSAIQENLYLKRLLAENKEDLATFENNVKALEKGIQSIKEFSESLNKPSEDSILIAKANGFFQFGSIYPIFTSSTSTFDDLSSTGNLKVLRNTGLRDKIVKHYAKHQQITERIRIGTEWALPIDAPFTYNNSIMRYEPASSFLFGDQNHKVLAQELRMHKDEYINNAAVHYWINLDAIDQLLELQNETSEIIDEIQSELM